VGSCEYKKMGKTKPKIPRKTYVFMILDSKTNPKATGEAGLTKVLPDGHWNALPNQGMRMRTRMITLLAE
jgi:hypothetical protein